MGLTIIKDVKIFEYRKNNDKYWNKAKLYKQVVKKALLIAKALYLGYSLCLLFDNVISYFVYVKNALHVKDMNKKVSQKHHILHNEWYD